MSEKWPIVLAMAAILLLSLTIIDAGCASFKPFSGHVIEKHFIPETTDVSTGVSGNGDVVVTSDTKQERYILFVELELGEVIQVDCDRDLYFSKNVEDRIDCAYVIGCITGSKIKAIGVR